MRLQQRVERRQRKVRKGTKVLTKNDNLVRKATVEDCTKRDVPLERATFASIGQMGDECERERNICSEKTSSLLQKLSPVEAQHIVRRSASVGVSGNLSQLLSSSSNKNYVHVALLHTTRVAGAVSFKDHFSTLSHCSRRV